MKKLRVTLFLILGLVLSVFFMGCYNNQQKRMYNDDKKIASKNDSYSFFKSSENNTDKDAKISFDKFDGTETIWIIKAKENSKINIKFDSKIHRGKFKTVLISSDNKVTNVLEHTKDSEKGEIDLKVKKGENRVKIVGSGAEGEVKLDIECDNNVNIVAYE